MKRRTEVELTRLQGEYRMRMAEAVMAFQYGDHIRSLWHQNEAAKIKSRMADLRRNGMPIRYKNDASKYDELYGQCEELAV